MVLWTDWPCNLSTQEAEVRGCHKCETILDSRIRLESQNDNSIVSFQNSSIKGT